LLLIIQMAFIVFALASDSQAAAIISGILSAAGIYLAVYVIYSPRRISSKACWVFLLLLFPVAGAVLYLLVHFQSSTRNISKNLTRTEEETKPLFNLHGDAEQAAVNEFPQYTNSIRYLQEYTGFPVYDKTRAVYYTPGERFLPAYLDALEKAERYIFLEYFIIGHGEMWDSILSVLKRKAAEGVDVRVMYDDIGSFLTLPKGYDKTLEGWGIKCRIFNPFRPVLSAVQNNRDHRKITSIDGKIAFTGGLNIADEYINAVQRFGYWKDCAIQFEGKAAWSLTIMFLQMWSIGSSGEESFAGYYPGHIAVISCGYIQPFADSPLDNESIGENVYLHIISSARKYLYLSTPYLIIDEKMLDALTSAAKSGVDVRIITPYIGDHKLVHIGTRSYYSTLIDAGVNVYEYTPGYIHSKNIVSDDAVGVVGTVNMDYRGMFQHFECGAVLYGAGAIMDIKKDFDDLFTVCRRVEMADCEAGIFKRLLQELIRLFSPLL